MSQVAAIQSAQTVAALRAAVANETSLAVACQDCLAKHFISLRERLLTAILYFDDENQRAHRPGVPRRLPSGLTKTPWSRVCGCLRFHFARPSVPLQPATRPRSATSTTSAASRWSVSLSPLNERDRPRICPSGSACWS